MKQSIEFYESALQDIKLTNMSEEVQKWLMDEHACDENNYAVIMFNYFVAREHKEIFKNHQSKNRDNDLEDRYILMLGSWQVAWSHSRTIEKSFSDIGLRYIPVPVKAADYIENAMRNNNSIDLIELTKALNDTYAENDKRDEGEGP